jgi:phosphotransferase system HPr-like phosphotransfer protein
MAVKNVTFQVTANTTQATQELAKITRGLELIQKKATIKVTADTTQATGRISNINSAITQLSKKTVSLKVDTKGATAEVKRLSDSLAKADKKTNITVQAQTSQARQALQGLINLINQLKQRVTITVNTSQVSAAQSRANQPPPVQPQPININSNTGQSTQQIIGLTAAVNFLSQSVANSSTNFVRLRNIIARTGVALGAVSIGASILSFGRAAVDAAKNYETLSVSFGTLIGNAVLADQKIKELRRFAAETPFTVDDVFQASRTLLGYGVTVGELIPTIKTLGDVAGGVGVPLERLALVFGQIRAAGRLYGQDLLQLVTAGFNPLSEISRTTGESFDSLKDKMRKGLITFEDVQNAFKTATSEGGKFFNLTNALANTTTGQLARLSEEYNELLRQIGEGLLPVYNRLINFGKASLEFFRELPTTIRENATVFTLLTAATTALTAAYFANSLNIVKNTALTVINTGVKIANRIATAFQAGAAVLAAQGLTAQTLATAALTTGTRLATAATNAFNAALSRNALGLIITLLATAASAWYAYGDAVDSANDGFIDADEAFKEFELSSKKAISEETAATKKLFDTAKDGSKSLRERQKAVDQVNEKYETSIKLVGDEKKDVKLLEDAWRDVEQAIIAVNEEKASTAIINKLNEQIADVQFELIKLASDAGLEIPIELIISDDEKQGGFKKTKALIQQRLDELGRLEPGNLLIGEALSIAPFSPAAAAGVLSFNQAINNQINGVEALNVQVEKLIESYGILGAFDQLVLPKTGGGTGKVVDDDAAKEALRRLKEFESEYASLLDRIRKNNEDIRRQDIEFSFVNAADFEEEIVKLQQLDRINEDTVNREIDREIESVRRREITEQQKNVLIQQLEIIRGQEQEKRAKDLEKRLYEIERDGNVARRKLANELGEVYQDLTNQRLDSELAALDRLRDGMDEFYMDIFEDNPFGKGKFIKAPRVEFGGTEFQFEDLKVDLEQLEKDILRFQAAGETAFDFEIDSINNSIDEFNKKYKTSIQLMGDEVSQAEELQKAYDEIRKSVQKENSERKRLNIFQFSRGVQERGLEDPFVTGIEDAQREYFSILEEREKQEKKKREDKRNADIALLDEDYALNLKAVNDAKKLREDDYLKEIGLIKKSSDSEEEKAKKIRLANLQYQIDIGNIEEAYKNTRLEIEKNIDVESDKGIKITKINAETEKDINDIQENYSQKRRDRSNKDTEAIEDNNEAQIAVINEERDARLQAIFDISQAVLDFTATFIDAQIKQTDAAIAQQQRRVDAAKEIADKGNVVLLKAEQERLDTLNRQKASFVRQQQSLAVIEIALNTAIAVSKAASQPGSPFTIIALLAAMAVGFAQARAQAQSAATFAKGGYTGDGHQFQEAGTVHKGEFVMNAQRTRQYRPLLEAIHSGRHPELAKSVNDKVFVVNSKSSDERLERIERAIREQQGMQLSIDENGINGIVSRISYKQQRINNRAR